MTQKEFDFIRESLLEKFDRMLNEIVENDKNKKESEKEPEKTKKGENK